MEPKVNGPSLMVAFLLAQAMEDRLKAPSTIQER